MRILGVGLGMHLSFSYIDRVVVVYKIIYSGVTWVLYGEFLFGCGDYWVGPGCG